MDSDEDLAAKEMIDYFLTNEIENESIEKLNTIFEENGELSEMEHAALVDIYDLETLGED